MDSRYMWYLRLVLPADSRMLVFCIASMQRSRGCLRRLEITAPIGMLLGLAGLSQQVRIHTPGAEAPLSPLDSQGACLW